MTNAAMTSRNLVASPQRDRRRAGRIEVESVLLPLLRNPSMAGLLIEHDERDMLKTTWVPVQRGVVAIVCPAVDDLESARGIVVSAVASMVLWGAIYAVGDMLWRVM
jgi:hypothetical protein